MFAKGSAGAAGRSRRVPGGFPHPRAGFRRRTLALLPRPGSSESPDRRMGILPRRWGSFRWPPPAPDRPSRKSGVAPAPRVHNNRGPKEPAPLLSAPTAPSDKFADRNKTLGRLPPSPSVVSGESCGPGLAR